MRTKVSTPLASAAGLRASTEDIVIYPLADSFPHGYMFVGGSVKHSFYLNRSARVQAGFDRDRAEYRIIRQCPSFCLGNFEQFLFDAVQGEFTTFKQHQAFRSKVLYLAAKL